MVEKRNPTDQGPLFGGTEGKHNQEVSVNATLKQEGEAGGRVWEERRCFGYDLFVLTMSRNHLLWTCVLETSVLVPLRQHDEAALFHLLWDHIELSTLLHWHGWNVRGTGRGMMMLDVRKGGNQSVRPDTRQGSILK